MPDSPLSSVGPASTPIPSPLLQDVPMPDSPLPSSSVGPASTPIASPPVGPVATPIGSPPVGPVATPIASPRIGIGVDVHPYADDDRPLSLAGLTWPGERGLAGHSDADVVAHAACDALFSAAGVGDLGAHFGTDRPELAGAAGFVLLAKAAQIVAEAGFAIGNIAIQIIGNSPRLGPRREEAQAVLAAAVAAPVSVSATTTDGLGLTGRGEGIAAIATAILFPTT